MSQNNYIIMSARVYFMKREKKHVSILSPQDEQ